jgi:hypothetical protein
MEESHVDRSMPIPSSEQIAIINAAKNKKNIQVSAVAGSGKTTTVGMIGKAMPDLNALLLTYNRRLRTETNTKLRKNHISNIQVSTFHSFCYNKYFVSGNTDQLIHDALDDWEDSDEIKFRYDMIILDEAQDLTPLYVRLVKMIVKHNKTKPQLVIIGDERQTIYSFNGADSRFLTHANKIFKFNNFKWSRLTLSTSYRMSNSMTNFINKCVLKEDLIVSNGETGIKPRYIFCDAFDMAPMNELILHYLVKFGYSYSDIFILAPSIQSDLSPIKMLANNLSTNHNIPVFMPTSDSDKLDTQLSNDKIVFATFHQVKGLERKCVLVMGFDNSYYYYYNPDGNKLTCPNELYVGLTRCSERLTIIHHYKKNFINFIDHNEIPRYCYTNKISTTDLELDYFNLNEVNMNERIFSPFTDRHGTVLRAIDAIMDLNNYNDSLNKEVKLSVTRLLSHLSYDTIKEALSFVKIRQIKNVAKNTGITSSCFDSDEESGKYACEEETIKNDKFVVSYFPTKTIIENVAEIVGTAIPIYYEYIKYGNLPILDAVQEELRSKPRGPMSVYRNIDYHFDRLKSLSVFKSVDIFELVTIYNGLTNNMIHKVNQIKSFAFMPTRDLKKCIKRLDNHIVRGKSNPRFEIHYEKTLSMNIPGYDVPVRRTLHGYVDCIDKQTLWEFKVIRTINDLHLLQLAVYAYLYYANMETGKRFKILNINDGTKYVISGHPKNFQSVVHFLFFKKFEKPIVLTDHEFIDLYGYGAR